MSGNKEQFPEELFKKDYPEHAKRVALAVQDWYPFGVNQFISMPSILKEVTSHFLQSAAERPEDIYIKGTPLSFALEHKRQAFIEQFKHIPPRLYFQKFGNWFNTHLHKDKSPATRASIEHLATTHIIHWMGSLAPEFKTAVTVWDEVDKNITDFSKRKTKQFHPVSLILFFSMHRAVIEQFISDEFTPQDLFGSSISQ